MEPHCKSSTACVLEQLNTTAPAVRCLPRATHKPILFDTSTLQVKHYHHYLTNKRGIGALGQAVAVQSVRSKGGRAVLRDQCGQAVWTPEPLPWCLRPLRSAMEGSGPDMFRCRENSESGKGLCSAAPSHVAQPKGSCSKCRGAARPGGPWSEEVSPRTRCWGRDIH